MVRSALRRPSSSSTAAWGSGLLRLSFLLALLGLLGLPRGCWAQRHDKRITGLGLVYGKTDTGLFGEGSWTRYVSDKTYLRLGASLARPDHLVRGGAASSAYGLSLAVAPLLFHLREIAYVHLLAGGLVRYERTNEDAAVAEAGVQQRFYGGPLLGVETDIFLGNRLSVVGTLQKALVFPEDGITRWPGFYGAGLRYHLR
ncbi:hypothetical protein GKZ68_20490 (plasmid) [Hymenobacter sp. BRD128]|uniref:hypothetical protein n=1 Tax=Hymenobacter sp. BRD128 TaxID=2675878 RepID=UPI001567908C|nr:hypothetical protein [Hymenobacter sp. BRD128]QKG59063.1 hypothetical protein GKZ68_20490 [Hymenobacter sp. BRD128]